MNDKEHYDLGCMALIGLIIVCVTIYNVARLFA